jgi:hypothetical protein
MKTALVTVEESHYAAPIATDYPYNVWLEGRWYHLNLGNNVVQIGDEITVWYHPDEQFATIGVKPKTVEPSDSDKQAKKIYNVLTSQRFADWYKDDGQLGCHITMDEFGATGAIPSEEQIMDYIKKNFFL